MLSFGVIIWCYYLFNVIIWCYHFSQFANVIIFVLSFFLVQHGCYHLCYHLMLSFFVIISPLFSFSWKRDTLLSSPWWASPRWQSRALLFSKVWWQSAQVLPPCGEMLNSSSSWRPKCWTAAWIRSILEVGKNAEQLVHGNLKKWSTCDYIQQI